MSKRKNKKANKSYKAKDEVKILNPRTFFKKIGISPIRDERVAYELEKAGLKGIPSLPRCNSNLKLEKIWWGRDFERICLIANELSRLNVPTNAKVLDIGGGPGHIAFWLRHIWPDCQITVADEYFNVGIKWAREIGVDNITHLLQLLKNSSAISYRCMP